MPVSAEEEATAGYQIFHRYFRARTPNKFLYSDAFLQHKGIISVTPQDAQAEMESMRMTVLTIAEIAELRYEGAPIDLVNPGDSEAIYNLIVRHLDDWFMIASCGIYDYLPPSNDLYLLDELAAELHIFVARKQMRELNEGVTSRQMGHSFLGTKRPSEQLTLDKAQAYKNKAPVIINKARHYYGAKEFGSQG